MGRKVAAVTAKEGYETVREKVRATGRTMPHVMR
jgi:hypothetical protein